MKSERIQRNSYSIRILTSSDIDELYCLHVTLLAQLPHPHVLRPDGRDFLLSNIERNGTTFGAFHEESLAAYAAVSFPGKIERNLSFDLPYLNIEADKVAIYDGSGVHPRHWGRRLHTELNLFRRKCAADGGFFHLMGTVSVLNPYSLSNHLQTGFFIKALKVKYGGMRRYVIHNDLRHAPTPSSEFTRSFEMNDLKRQEQAIDEGYWGCKVIKAEDTVKICYRKFSIANASAYIE